MTVEEITAALSDIRENVDDDVYAHEVEDELWEQVLRAIADGAAEPAVLAAEALKTKEMDFARWRA